MGGTGEEEEEEENDNGIVTNPIIIKIMPRLQSLIITLYPNLKSLPDYLLTAASLKELEISYSGLKERYQRNWHKISHISNIKFGEVYVQRDSLFLYSEVTLLPFFFFLYFIFSLQIYQLNINIWIGLWNQSGSLVYFNSPPLNANFYTCIFIYLLNISI